MTKYDIFEGFGAKHTAGQWADLLGIPLRIFRYYVETEGLTVEGIYKRYGYLYQPPEPKGRKPREGKHMTETRQRMYKLLLISGYIGPDDGPECITVKPFDKNGNHLILFQERKVGTYNYKTGALKLSGGGGLPLWDLDWEDAMIRRNSAGFWMVHPETQRAIARQAIEKRSGEIAQNEYDENAAKYQKDPASEQWEKYEGFGHSYTAAEWARRLGVSKTTLWRHLKAGKTVEEFAAKKRTK